MQYGLSFFFPTSNLSLLENVKFQDTGLKNKAQFYSFALGAGLGSHGGKGEHAQSKRWRKSMAQTVNCMEQLEKPLIVHLLNHLP